MQIDYLEINNFKSIKNIKLDLKQYHNKTILINGSNLDEKGASSNRTGKSNFSESIIWALFGSLLIRGTNEELIRYGEKECGVLIRFDNGVEIERRLKSKAQTFYYRVGGKDKAESNADAQDIFLSDIGIKSKNNALIKNGIFLNNNTDTLISATPMKRLEIFTDWFDLTKYDKAVNLTRDKIKEWINKKEQLTLLKFNQEELDELDDSLMILSASLVPIKSRLQIMRDKQNDFINYNNNKKEYDRLAQDIKQHNQEEENIKQAVQEINKIDINKIQIEVQKIKEENETKTIRKKELVSEINQLQGQIVSPMPCPKCGTALVKLSTGLTIVSVQAIEKIKQEVETKSKELSNIKLESTTELDKVVKTFESLERIIDKVLPNITEKINRSKELETILAITPIDYSKDINKQEEIISSTQRKIGITEANIQSLKESKVKYEQAQPIIAELENNIKLGVLWAGQRNTTGLFQEIKSLTLIKNITNLNAITNLILEEKFSIDSKISLVISEKGINIYRERNFSIETCTGGEAARISFAIALALKQIYSSKLELLLIDEFFSALDSIGMEYVINILNSYIGIKFIISHVSVECENILNLEKKNGITYLVKE